MSYVKDKSRNKMSADTLDDHLRIRSNPQNVRELNSFCIAENFLKHHRITPSSSDDSSIIYFIFKYLIMFIHRSGEKISPANRK